MPLSKKGRIVWLFLILLTYFKFFKIVGLNDVVVKAVYYVVLGVIAGAIVVGRNKFDNAKFLLPYNLMVIGIVISILMSEIYWGQSLIVTLVASIPLFSFIIYPYLHKSTFSTMDIERGVGLFTLVYVICFLIALVIYPTKIFEGFGEGENQIDVSRGFPRIRLTIMGAAPVFFVFFLALSKYKNAAVLKFKRRWFWLAVIMFVFIILQLGRQSILLSFLLGLFYFTDKYKLHVRLLLSAVLVFASWLLLSEVSVIKKMTEETTTQYESHVSDEENIRLLSYAFYFSNVSPAVFTDLFGNGQYSLGNSYYGDFIDTKGRANGLIPADVGYAHIYLILGYFGLIVFAFLMYYLLRVKVSSEFKYLKYYIVFLYLSNIGGNTLLGTIPLFCISFYLLDIGHFRFKKLQHDKANHIRTVPV